MRGRNGQEERDMCQWPRCRRPSVLYYLGKGLCGYHWEHVAHVTDTESGREMVRRKLRATPALPAATEVEQ